MTLQFKIQLRNITNPPVWRRLVIPGDFTFHQFHQAIQEAFGWFTEHMYMFQQKPYSRGWTMMDLCDKETREMNRDADDANQQQVASFVKVMGLKKFVYIYDFGDNWIHDITLEQINDDATLEHPVCLAGKGACPYEDCGGPGGYEAMKKAFATDPYGDDANEYRERIGLDEDEMLEPDFFDLEDTNIALKDVPWDAEQEIDVADLPDDEEDEDDDDFDDYEEIDDDDDDEPLWDDEEDIHDPITIAEILDRVEKDELIEHAHDLGLELAPKGRLNDLKQQYAQHLITHPKELLQQLSMYDLLTLKCLSEAPNKLNLVTVYENFFPSLLIEYYMAEPVYGRNDYLQIPTDLWPAWEPHVSEIINDQTLKMRSCRLGIIEGLCNLYGQITRRFAKQELVKATFAKDTEQADDILNDLQQHSLQMKRMGLGPSDNIEYTNDDWIYISEYGWQSQEELMKQAKLNANKDYRVFNHADIIPASLEPFPTIPNERQETFSNFLKQKLKLNESEVVDYCHTIWYYAMTTPEGDNDNSPGCFFVDCVLNFSDVDIDKALFFEALAQLDDYLNHMPHWKLCGYTPLEAGAPLYHYIDIYHYKRKFSSHDDDQSWLHPTMPYIAPKTPGRNEPCPCGSGKKYKNCCGRGN